MIPSAQAQLWRRLRDDELSATVSADGMVSKIPAREWAYLELTDFHGEDFLAVRSGNSLSRKYLARDVLIARLDLMRLWRHEPRPTARGEARATKDLERAVELYREGKDPLPVYAKWSVTAPKEYSITGRGARRAWDKAAANYPELSSPKGKTKTRRGDKATSNHRT